MKSYSEFLIEYDAKQLASANPKQAAIAQRRQRQRELAGGKGSEGSSSPLNPAMKGSQEKARRIKQGNNKGLQAPKAIEKRPSSRAVDKPGALAKASSSLATIPKGKSGPLALRGPQSRTGPGEKPNRSPKPYRDPSGEQRRRILKNSPMKGEKEGLKKLGKSAVKAIRKGMSPTGDQKYQTGSIKGLNDYTGGMR